MQSVAQASVLALDLGSTSAKALVVAPDGRVFARAEEPIVTVHGADGIAEIDVEEALEAARRAVQQVAPACGGRPRAFALACAMHGVVPIDADARPLARLRTWADARGADIARELRADGSWRALQEQSGTPVHASSPLCKIAAMRRHEPALFDAAHAFVSLKEVLLRRLCGAEVIDASLASATGLWDLARRAWNPAALTIAGVGAERLSRIVPTRHIETDWLPGTAARFGLDARTPIQIGASDGCLANVGLGALGHGVAAASVGTSAAARAAVRRPRVDADRGLFCYALDEEVWIVGGAVNDMGNAVQWLSDLLFHDVAPQRRHAAFMAAAARVPDGARGLRFTPGLSGTRFPDYAATPRGGFEGLAIAHGRDECARAMLEGLASQLAGIIAAMRSQDIAIDCVRLGGGLTRAKVFRAILAERIGVRIEGDDEPDATALGAAQLAWAALYSSPLPGTESLA